MFGNLYRPAALLAVSLGLSQPLCAQPVSVQTVPAQPVPAQPAVAQPVPAAPTGGDDAVIINHETVLDVAVAGQRYRQLVRLLQASGVAETIERSGPFTLLAPDDTAMAAWGQKRIDALLQPKKRAALLALVETHVVRGYLSYANLQRQLDHNGGVGSLTTLNGRTLTVTKDPKTGVIGITGAGRIPASVAKGDVPAFNGTVLTLGAVLLPPPAPKVR